jgi:hypothetical protein
MLAVQPRLPLILPMQARARRVRRPFHPSQGEGTYRLPRDVRDRLAAALAHYRNREAAFALATFIARFWSAPGRIVESFHIDRRAIAGRPDLGLTEDRVRGAIRVLEEVGFLDRAIRPSGSKYKATEGGLHRKPIRFVFGSEYGPLFIAANKRSKLARGGHAGDRRPIMPSNASRLPTAFPEAKKFNSPKSKSVADPKVNLGDLRTGKTIGLPPKTFEPDANLEAALERLRQGVIGKAGRG